MRKRIWIPCVVGLAICLLLVMLKPTKHQKTALPAQSETATNQPSHRDQTKVVENRQATNTSPTVQLPPHATPLAQTRKNKHRRRPHAGGVANPDRVLWQSD